MNKENHKAIAEIINRRICRAKQYPKVTKEEHIKQIGKDLAEHFEKEDKVTQIIKEYKLKDWDDVKKQHSSVISMVAYICNKVSNDVDYNKQQFLKEAGVEE